MTPRWVLASVAVLIVLSGCVDGSSAMPSGGRPSGSTVPASAASVESTQALSAADRYQELASTVNAEWRQLGDPPRSDASLDAKREFEQRWFTIESEIVDGIDAIEWPVNSRTEALRLQASAKNVLTMLQPGESSGQFLDLILFTARDQFAGAQALRERIGLPHSADGELL